MEGERRSLRNQDTNQVELYRFVSLVNAVSITSLPYDSVVLKLLYRSHGGDPVPHPTGNVISVLSFGVLRFLFDHLVFYETYRRAFLGKLNERMGSGLLVLEGESID